MSRTEEKAGMTPKLYKYDPVIGCRFIPGMNVLVPHEGGGYLVRTNSSGFRCDHEITPAKPKGTFRIILFGDSATAADGVNNEQRYGDILEKSLEGLQILNFALPGKGMDQQYLIFTELAKDLEYDLLMICPLVTKIRLVCSRYRFVTSRENNEPGYLAKPYFELANDKLVLRNVPVPRGFISEKDMPEDGLRYVDRGGPAPRLRRFANAYLKPFKSIVQSMIAYQPVPLYDDPDNPAWKLMKAILVEWISESRGRHVLICPIPLYHHIEQTASPASYQLRFQELAGPDNVTVADPLPRFWAESPDNRRYCRFRNDPHLTPYGHEVLADAMKPVIAHFLSGVASA
jgi:hypothetical protein